MHAYAAMGPTIAARSVNLGTMRGAQPVETGSDRQIYDTEFGKGVEVALQELYDRTWRLLEDNRAEVLTLGHALETHKTITGDDVAAVLEGTQGPIVDGRPYTDAFFRDQLEAYHEAVLRAHAEHGGVEAPVPVPLPPPPPLVVAGDGNGSRGSLPAAEPERTAMRPDGEDEPPA
jgi:cell division protease FtsH